MAIKAVLFDLGSTLVQYNTRNVSELYKEGARLAYDFAKGQGYPLSDFDGLLSDILAGLEAERQRVVASEKEVVARSVVSKILNEIDVALTPSDWNRFELEWNRPMAQDALIVPGVQEVLMSLLEHGAKLGVVTNSWWARGPVERDLERLDLWEYFDAIVVSSEIGSRIPSSKLFETALHRLGADAHNALFVTGEPNTLNASTELMGIQTILYGTDVPDMKTLTKRIGGMMI